MAETSERNIWLNVGDLLETLLEVEQEEVKQGPLGVEQERRKRAMRNVDVIADFARNSVVAASVADFARALTVLRAGGHTTVRASLQVAPDIEKLPTIQRTGISTPTMDGLQLGFDSDRVDDPHHQRCGSLYFTKAARDQELTSLLLNFLTLWPSCKFPEDQLRARSVLDSKESERLEFLLTQLLEASTLENPAEVVNQVLGRPQEKIPTDLAAAIYKDRRKDLPQELSAQAKNALSGLYLQYRAVLDSDRHFGAERLRPFEIEGVSNLVVQGAGDLSMNPWNVGLYRDKEKKPHTIIPADEPFSSRRYNCLVGLTSNVTGVFSDYLSEKKRRVGDVAIIPLRFSPGPIALVDPRHNVGQIKNEITFALYGKLVLRDGCVVDPVEMVDEFLDLRHIFDLPNLNLDDEQRLSSAFKELESQSQLDKSFKRQFDSMVKKPLDEKKPQRILFGQMQSTDVWLLENALLGDANLRHLACLSSIAVPLDRLGAPKDWISVCLSAWGYKLKPAPENLSEGDFTWDSRNISSPVLHVRLRWATYPCTMVGLGSVEKGPEGFPDCVYLLAFGHDFKHARHTIRDCAEVLRAAGARWALVIDEGQDVFQFYAKDDKELDRFSRLEAQRGDLSEFFRVPFAFDVSDERKLKRTSLRASIAFWHEKTKDELHGK